MGCMQSAAFGSFRISSWKGFSRRSPPSDMDSAPIATPMSMLPLMIWLATSWTALSPDEQKRFTEEAPAVVGYPAAREAARAM